MTTRTTYWPIWCLAAAVVLTTIVGCKKEEQPQKEEPVTKAVPTEEAAVPEKEVAPKVEGLTKEVAAEMQADVDARLAKADAFDGTVDKVVSKCPACGLAMDGKSENALEVSGYKLHFCTNLCKEGYEKDPAKAVLAMKIPKD
jgi:YHS domain-containing protein